MDRIVRIELYRVAIPLPARFYPSWIPGLPQTENRFTLIKVITEQGIEGWSAGPAMGRERAGLGELLGPYLIGEDAISTRRIQQRLRELSYLDRRNVWIEPASETFRERGQVSRSVLLRLSFFSSREDLSCKPAPPADQAAALAWRFSVLRACVEPSMPAIGPHAGRPRPMRTLVAAPSRSVNSWVDSRYPSSCTAPQALIDEAEALFQEGF